MYNNYVLITEQNCVRILNRRANLQYLHIKSTKNYKFHYKIDKKAKFCKISDNNTQKTINNILQIEKR